MKTKGVILLLIFLLIKVSVHSQSTETVSTNTIVIGKNEDTQKDITATEYTFKDRIHEIYVNAQSNDVTLQIRGTSKNGKWLDNKGEIVLFDLESHQTKWIRKINYQSEYLSQFGNTFILNNNFVKAASQKINAETGKGLAELKHKVYYVDTTNDVSIGYIVKASGVSYQLVGVDVKDISLKWERELKRDYYWDGLKYINDSTLLVSAAGLHSININTGKGWDYNAITGKKNYKTAAITTVAGITAGLLTGTYFYATDPDLLHGIVSNTLEDSSAFYYASKEELTKIDKVNGQVIWKFPFDENEASHSNIFLIDDRLIMINFGYAFLDNNTIGYGKPFIASFDKNTGNQIFVTDIGDKKNPIKSIFRKKESVLLLFNDSIAAYNINTGLRIGGNKIEKKKNEDLLFFLDNNIYYNVNDSLNPRFKRFDNTKAYVFSDENIIYEINNDLTVSKTFKREDLFFTIVNTGNLNLINRRNQSYILNKNAEIIARFNTSGQSVLKNGLLYDFSDNKLIEVNLSDFFK
ncbi:PQQ-like beta-propeller repeat protein [Taibaiella lutea]|uniref:PQQ-like beta-propeller repeat protein n=1 Tax=Taibaiella lutea TaxID=2608001 RepID=A0A5M6CCS7_9BACT|nr:PQQ-binding-like beta-propeller repeat protein [Taibaiella lutea]KAA5532260.1 PQQ-like beta-propeller repeat protein [Taibaiella lutea]